MACHFRFGEGGKRGVCLFLFFNMPDKPSLFSLAFSLALRFLNFFLFLFSHLRKMDWVFGWLGDGGFFRELSGTMIG